MQTKQEENAMIDLSIEQLSVIISSLDTESIRLEDIKSPSERTKKKLAVIEELYVVLEKERKEKRKL